MSNRTMNNAPLPTIGSQNWGATLNNYLRTQHYEHAELQEELNNLYEQSTNTIQTVLSSGIVARNIDSQRPGLYANDQITYIEDGTQILSDASSYCGFKGYGVIIGGTNFTDILHSGEADDNKSQLKMTKTQVDEAFTSSETYDARCVYAYYNSTSKFWEVKFSSELTENNSISLNPYYICLGVIIKWNTNYYWHYKTMKANLSISSKKWMLDEPHAMLNTYISARGTANSMTLEPFADTNFPNATLTVQALGINPFTTYESGSNELSADIKQWNLNAYNTANNFQFIVLYKNKNNVIAPISTTSAGALTAITNLSSSATYRLCATAVTIAGKPLLILQKAYAGEGVSKSLFDEDEFGKILYFTDPVELYRLSINSSGNLTMTAAVGNGISTVNANGINPHVTTLIRHDDNVLFGEETGKAFHFKSKDEETDSGFWDSKFEVVMTQPDQPSDTSFVLTNAMEAIANPIKIQNSLPPLTAEGNSVDNYIKMYRGNSAANFHNITLATQQGGEGAYAHFTGQGYIKLGTYRETESFNVDSGTPNASIYIKSKNRGTENSNSNIQLIADYIDSRADGITSITNDWRLNNETADYCTIQYSGEKPQIHLGTDSSKKVVIYAGTTTEDPCILVGGGGTKLSSEGLYFPSGSNIDGITIDDIKGKIEDSSAHKFYNVGLGDLANWTNGEATTETVGSWTITSYSTVTQCKAPMAEVYGQSNTYPWNFHSAGYAHWFWFRNPSEDESAISVDQPPAVNEGDSITITYTKNSTGEEVTETYGNWAIVGDRHGRYGYIKDAGDNIIWTIILSTTPSIITNNLAPKLNNPLHIKNYFLCGMISSSKLDLKAYGADVKVKINNQATALTKIGTISEASLTLSTLTDYAYMNIDHIGNGNLGIRSTSENSWISISDGFNGCLYMYGCNSGGRAIMLNNSGTITIKKNNSTIKVYTDLAETNGWKAYKNIIGPQSYTIDNTYINKLQKLWDHLPDKSEASGPLPYFLYRNYPLSSGVDRNTTGRQMTLRRYFNYDKEDIPKDAWQYLYLPDLRTIQFEIQIVDDKWDQAWANAYFCKVKWDPLNNHLWDNSCTADGSACTHKVTKLGKEEVNSILNTDRPDAERSFTFHIDGHAAFGIKLQYITAQAKFRIAWSRISDICSFDYTTGNCCVIFTIVDATTDTQTRWYSYTPIVTGA